MRKNSVLNTQAAMPNLLLIPAAIGINYIGKLIINLLNLPLWMDSIGTFIASMLGGPIVGALSGLLSNMLYGFLLDSVSFFYGITSAVMALAVGAMAGRWLKSGWRGILLMGVVTAFVAAIVSTPINMIFWDGANGNLWGDMLFDTASRAIPSILISSFLAELAVDLPDKIITIFASYAIYKNLPKTIHKLY